MKSCVDGQNHLLWLTRGDADGRCRPLCMHSAVVQTELSFIWSSTICESHSFVSHSLRPHRLYSPWNSPGQNTGVGSFSLLQGIFPTQGLNPGLLHCRQILYQLSYPKQLEKEETKNPGVSRRKEIIKIRAEINEKEIKETIAKINKLKAGSLSR